MPDEYIPGPPGTKVMLPVGGASKSTTPTHGQSKAEAWLEGVLKQREAYEKFVALHNLTSQMQGKSAGLPQIKATLLALKAEIEREPERKAKYASQLVKINDILAHLKRKGL